jgi:DNA helicase II / ATP-dependent DNA helicase PcrA
VGGSSVPSTPFAAKIRNILDFPARFSPPARVVTLERN